MNREKMRTKYQNILTELYQMALSIQSAIVQAHCFQCDFLSCSRQTWRWSFIMLRTNSPTMAVLQFPSHRVQTETNHPFIPNSRLLSHHLQSEHTVFFLVSPSFLIPPLLPSSPLPLSSHLSTSGSAASLRHTRVSLSFGSEGWDERQREARE